MDPCLMGDKGIWGGADYLVTLGSWGGCACSMAFDTDLRVVEDRELKDFSRRLRDV